MLEMKLRSTVDVVYPFGGGRPGKGQIEVWISGDSRHTKAKEIHVAGILGGLKTKNLEVHMRKIEDHLVAMEKKIDEMVKIFGVMIKSSLSLELLYSVDFNVLVAMIIIVLTCQDPSPP